MQIQRLTHDIIQESLCLEEVLRQLKPTKRFSLDAMHKILDELHASGGSVFLMMYKNKAIGNISVFIQTRFLGNGKRAAYIEDVTTHPEYENKEIASRLIEHAVTYAKEQGAYKICLYCKEALVPFYERFRFKVANVFLQKRF